MAKTGKAAPEEAEAPAKPKSKRLLLAVVVVLVLGAIGGAGWHFLKGSKSEEPKPVVVVKPVFVALEPFTVNLQHEEGDQFLQLGITLKVSGVDMEEKIKERLPEIRSRLLFLLSSKRPSELVPVEGKKKLAHEIVVETNAALGLGKTAPKGAAHDGVAKDAASGVSVVAATADESNASAPAKAATAVHGDAPATGVLEVLFTSFIIQ